MDKNTINKSSILSTNKTVTPSVQYSTKRFFILIQACLTSFANGYQWFIISSEFHKDFMNTYKLTNFTVNLFSYFYSFSFILTLYIAYILIEKVNYFLSIKFAATLTILGCLLRIFINYHIMCAYVGQALCAFGCPFVLNSSAKVAGLLFPQSQRIFCITMIFVSNQFGIFLSLILPKIAVYAELGQNFTDIIEHYFILAAFISLFCIPSIFCPCETESQESKSIYYQNEANLHYWGNIRKLVSNTSFLYFTISFSCVQGLYYAYSPVMEKVLTTHEKQYGEAEDFFKAFSLGSGILSAIILSFWTSRTKMYKCTLIVLIVFSLISMICVSFYCEKTEGDYNNIVLTIAYVLYGISVLPFFSVGFTFSMEITYPVSTTLTLCIILVSSKVVSLILTTIFEQITKGIYINLISIFATLIGLIFMFLSDENLILSWVDNVDDDLLIQRLR